MNDHPTVLCTGPISQESECTLGSYGRIVIADDIRESSLVEMAAGAVAMVVGSEGTISRRIIEAAPNLKVIGRSGAGYNNIDIHAATARGIPVIYTPGANADTVAEASITLILTLAKHTLYWDRALKSGNWASRNEYRNVDLQGQTLGIVGFGAIGQSLARMAAGFSMTMMAYDPYADRGQASKLNVELVELDQLLSRSRFICLHCALTDETQGLINPDSLSRCNHDTFLINLARGGLIESLDCLHEAIQNGPLAGVGLDVFSPEPPDVTHPIFRDERCVTAPHALGISQATMDRIFSVMANAMVAVLQGQQPDNVVNAEVFDRF